MTRTKDLRWWWSVGCCVFLLGVLLGCKESSHSQGAGQTFVIPKGRGLPPMPRFRPLHFRDRPLPRVFSHAQTQKKPKYRPAPAARATARKAAKPKKLTGRNKSFARKVKRHFGEGRQRRALLETDKPIYRPGETIWVRAVLLRLQDNRPESHRTRGRFSLLSPRGVPVQKRLVYTQKGHSAADFALAKEAVGGQYTIRFVDLLTGTKATHKVFVTAFQAPRIKKTLTFVRQAYGPGDTVSANLTMKRATGEPLAQKQIEVLVKIAGRTIRQKWQTLSAKGKASISFALPKPLKSSDGLLTVSVSDGGVRESITRPIPIILRTIKLRFFPEGGRTYINQPARIYVAARHPVSGDPVDFSGVIKNPRGQVVAQVRTFHDGMGRFVYTPRLAQRCKLHITRPVGISETFPLPKSGGMNGVSFMHIDDFHSTRKSLHLQVHTNRPQSIVVTALQHEQLIAHKAFSLRKGAQKLVLPLRKQWRGILRLTLFTPAYAPIAERLVFRHRGKGLKLTLRTSRKVFRPRDTVSLTIKVATPDGRPVPNAVLGVAAVDDTVLRYADDHEPAFLAQRYLTGQLTGKIHKPNFYFKADEPKAPRALDLLMGTQGWRSFRLSWKRVKQGKALPPPPRFLFSSDHRDLLRRLAQGERLSYDPLATALLRLHKDAKAIRKATITRKQTRKTLPPRPRKTKTPTPRKPRKPAQARKTQIKAPKQTTPSSASDKPRPASRKPQAPAARPVMAKRRRRRPPRSVAQVFPVLLQQGKLNDRLFWRVLEKKRFDWGSCHDGITLLHSVHVRLSRSGRVSSAKYLKTPKHKRVARCLLRQVRKTRFPALRSKAASLILPLALRYEYGGLSPEALRRTLSPVRTFPTKFYKTRSNLRNDFRDTVYWNPRLVTNKRGVATVSFGLSDSVSSFRVKVSGVGAGMLGQKDLLLAAKRPFFMAIKLPLEVSAGDAMALPLTLRNDSPEPIPVRIKLTLSPHFKLMENPLPETRTIQPKEAWTFFYPIRVVQQRGSGTVSFSASGGGAADRLQRTIRIRPRGFPRTIARAGSLKSDKPLRVSFSLPSDLQSATPQAHASLLLNPIASLTKGMAAMLREPHGCFEQTSSTNYPNILVLQTMKYYKTLDAALASRSRGYLARGYRKLAGYEVKGGGFSLFGSPPASTILTAYGILQFSHMRKVYSGVSTSLIRRSARWLRAQRTDKDNFRHTRGASMNDIVDAYILYSLAEARNSHRKDFARLEKLALKALKVQDPYFLSLTFLGMIRHHPELRDGNALWLKKLIEMQEHDGSFKGKKNSIMYAYGDSLQVETTALALLAMSRTKAPADKAAKAATWLRKKRSPYGSFGSTQATILSLQALLAYAKAYPAVKSKGSTTLVANGKAFSPIPFGPKTVNSIETFAPSNAFRAGNNSLTLSLSSTKPLSVPFFFGVRYYTFQPPSSIGAPVSLDLKLDKTSAKIGQNVRLSATLTNTTAKTLPMVLARLRFPGALQTQLWQLKKLKKDKVVDFLETNPREVILYLKRLPPRAKKTVHIDLSANVTGNYNSSASLAYLYYNPKRKSWTHPLHVSITP